MWEAFFAFHVCIAYCVSKFLRCPVAEGAVQTHLIVVKPLVFDGLSGIV